MTGERNTGQLARDYHILGSVMSLGERGSSGFTIGELVDVANELNQRKFERSFAPHECRSVISSCPDFFEFFTEPSNPSVELVRMIDIQKFIVYLNDTYLKVFCS